MIGTIHSICDWTAESGAVGVGWSFAEGGVRDDVSGRT
jgi:hypothetical protein